MSKKDAQSLSICVPGKACINRCKYCVACMHTDVYKNQMDENLPFYDLYLKDYIRRMIFAKENDANIMMITGDIEPLQNREFLMTLSLLNNFVLPQKGCTSFNWIELQTSGATFNKNYARFLRNTVGVSVLSLSLSSFDDNDNNEISGIRGKNRVCIEEVCHIAKEYDFTLRLSLNMNKMMLKSVEGKVEEIFKKSKELEADQITFRKLYVEGENEQSIWIKENAVEPEVFEEINKYIRENGKLIDILPYGYEQYSVEDMSVVIDMDCMNEQKSQKQVSKYFVLRPNCKIYNGWQKEDLIF